MFLGPLTMCKLRTADTAISVFGRLWECNLAYSPLLISEYSVLSHSVRVR